MWRLENFSGSIKELLRLCTMTRFRRRSSLLESWQSVKIEGQEKATQRRRAARMRQRQQAARGREDGEKASGEDEEALASSERMRPLPARIVETWGAGAAAAASGEDVCGEVTEVAEGSGRRRERSRRRVRAQPSAARTLAGRSWRSPRGAGSGRGCYRRGGSREGRRGARGASAAAAVDGCCGGHGRSRRRRGQSRRARGGRKSSSSRRSFPSAAVLPSSGTVLPSSSCPCIRHRDEDNKMKTETAKNATERTEIVMK
uniref:Uncharacterized protein n=2 Tax=Oryza sativa subsp. japonica TaxID=39947 RepID=A0A5S6RCR6_ORYSJ|nr:Hypothetical protein [Oryza sativa]AAN04134.1 Hypothetical protein [Oryza sativa Japonica Group]AAP52218.1 hypothetical protein LOC_Os10g07050 [Oryza sativa Japonica Group]